MASIAQSATEAAPEVDVPASEVFPVDESKTSVRSFYRLESDTLVSCEPNAAEIIIYTSPTLDDEAELQEQYKIDYHPLQSSLDPDELSRLEIERDHVSIIFKRPKSFCAGDNFPLKLTSTGVFLYEHYLLIVMADDSPIFEGRVPFPVKSIHDVMLRLLYQATMHFEAPEGHQHAGRLPTAPHQHLSGKQISPQHVRARKEPRLYPQLAHFERLASGKNEEFIREARLQ